MHKSAKYLRMFIDKSPNTRRDFLLIVPTFRTFYANIIDKRPHFSWNLAIVYSPNNTYKLRHRISPPLRESCHSDKSQQAHECSEIARGSIERNLVITSEIVDSGGYWISSKVFRELVHRRRHPRIANSNFV